MGYSANTKTGVGIRDQEGGRNSPVSFNRILSGPQFWDGRVDSLEAQAVGPIANPIEMGFTHEGVVKRLGEMPVYARQFAAIFGELTIERVGEAIASFERALVTAPAPFDYYEQLLPFSKIDEEDIADDEELAAEAVDVAIAADALLDAHDVAARWYEAAFEISPSLASVGALVRRAHDARDHAAAEALLSQYVATEDDPDVRGQLQYELGWLRVAIEDRPGALSAM